MAGNYAGNPAGCPVAARVPRVLALETSGDACSVAVLGPDGLCEEHLHAPRQHTALVFELIDAALTGAGLTRADLELVAFGCGPGSFTGVRIAAAIAQGIALARDLPLAPVSTLRAVAAGAMRASGARAVIVALDARRGEVYNAAYTASEVGMTAHSAERVCAPGAVTLPALDAAWSTAGNGWHVHAGAFAATLTTLPHAAFDCARAGDVARLAGVDFGAGRTVRAAAAVPVYLRGAVE